MSRCFSYSHRSCKTEDDAAMIGSIKKLHNQWGNTKKREQVSTRTIEKNLKKRPREEHVRKLDSSKIQINKKIKAAKTIEFNENCCYTKKEDSDHLERSGLSEELDPPVFMLRRSNSEITQNSIKNNPPPVVDPIGNIRSRMILRLKLPLKRHQGLDPCSQAISNNQHSSSHDQPVSTDCALRSPEEPPATLPFSASAAEPCFSGRSPPTLECFAPTNVRGIRGRVQKSERQLYRDLIVNWKPLSIERSNATTESELDWLLSPKKTPFAKQPAAPMRKIGISNGSLTNPNSPASCLQPRATFLPEFAIYQMPYVIPF